MTVSFGLGICGELCWFYYDVNPMCVGLGDGRHFQRFWLVVSIVIIVIISDVVSIVMDCNRRREARLYIGMPSEEKRTRKGLHLDFHLILLFICQNHSYFDSFLFDGRGLTDEKQESMIA